MTFQSLGNLELPTIFANPGRMRRFNFPVNPGIREQVFNRDGWKCVKCGLTENLTLDHIIPKSKGGKSVIGNLQTMCAKCNGMKGNKIE